MENTRVGTAVPRDRSTRIRWHDAKRGWSEPFDISIIKPSSNSWVVNIFCQPTKPIKLARVVGCHLAHFAAPNRAPLVWLPLSLLELVSTDCQSNFRIQRDVMLITACCMEYVLQTSTRMTRCSVVQNKSSVQSHPVHLCLHPLQTPSIIHFKNTRALLLPLSWLWSSSNKGRYQESLIEFQPSPPSYSVLPVRCHARSL